ncbi:ComEC/Rec2 family competence protein [Lichenifustis flavocetrariae]|uniref:ComEC family competence protein n=1 Tax=Lichenifustis flavocetrariae TaxID=2949735 RepID=A0AA41Z6B5_9HYPH|nr:ComEC/Rec2 family competence protein [Lichenifustis flavocetrariae]MCW6510077.1 ComEC family competence protein [Lichenifustis flavocetrariae]
MATATGRQDSSIALGTRTRVERLRDALASPAGLLSGALEREWEERRFFLWLPVGAGAGVVLYFQAEREPSLLYCGMLFAVALGGTVASRHHRRALVLMAAFTAVLAGFTLATFRAHVIAHPVLVRTAIMKLTGVVEEADHRRIGTRFILRIRASSGGPPLTRVRLTTRRSDPVEAGDSVSVTARLVPPARAALPGGYDFARDAYFLGFDAVGSVLGRIVARPPPLDLSWNERWTMAIDRARNALAARVRDSLEGDAGAIGAAMVTGKRDLLSEDGRDLIREAGIFHIITIAGVQMTLVAGLLFGGLRGALALVPGFALRYPIKQWAAAGAIVGAVAYDLLTGSRIGTQRALFMTLIVLGAILCNRRAFTMRNLALAAMAVVVFEPETILGASFQLSFAAVAALVAVQESRHPESERGGRSAVTKRLSNLGLSGSVVEAAAALVATGGRLLFATICASSATMPFMATNFHEISPYVVIGNPLTLAIIEFFAVPGALLGTVLVPLGLDGFVWHWVGFGIAIVLWAARLIAAAPGATLHVPAFAPWTPACVALAVASVVIWRSTSLRLTAVPLLLLGLAGAFTGPRYDLVIAPTGDTLAFRDAQGRLATLGHINAFGAAQWLTADGDDRDPKSVGGSDVSRCDPLACVATVLDGRTLSLVLKPEAFEEDCRRADLIVTPLYAPASCAAEMIIDRGILAETGAAAVTLRNGALVVEPARRKGEDRPWSPAPPRPHVRPGREVADGERDP